MTSDLRHPMGLCHPVALSCANNTFMFIHPLLIRVIQGGKHTTPYLYKWFSHYRSVLQNMVSFIGLFCKRDYNFKELLILRKSLQRNYIFTCKNTRHLIFISDFLLFYTFFFTSVLFYIFFFTSFLHTTPYLYKWFSTKEPCNGWLLFACSPALSHTHTLSHIYSPTPRSFSLSFARTSARARARVHHSMGWLDSSKL